MPDSSNFDVWVWSSAHPERPSRSRPNTRAPNKYSRASRRRADPSAVSSPPDSPFLSCCSSLSSIASTLPDYDSTSFKQKPNVRARKDVSSMGSRSSLLQRFEQYSTGEVLYALIALGLTQDPKNSPIQHGGLLPDVYMLSPLSINPFQQAHRICGFAYNIEMTRPGENVNLQHFFETVSNENIIISSSSDTEYTGWDKSMTVNARNQGVRGTIVNGLTTDLTTHREAGFSVFSQGYSPPGRATAASPSRTNMPVTFSPRSHFGTYFKDSLSAVQVYPGDIIVADVGGAVCVPFSSAEEVLNMCGVQAQSTSMVAKGV